MDASPTPRPNFFIVGAPKCGTTALYTYLRQHPDVFMPRRKEPRFFATDLDSGSPKDARYFVRDREAYLELFAPAGCASRVGEASALYLYSTAAAKNIKGFCWDSKIIIMLRDPIDLMHAFHGERLYNGNEDINDFEEALAAEAERKRGLRIPPQSLIPQALCYRDVATLSVQIERYTALFDRENIKFVILDDFTRDLRGIFREILEFLNVHTGFTPEFPRVNSNKRVRSKRLRNMMRYPPPLVFRTARAVLPRKIRRGILTGVRSVNVIREGRPPMDPRLRKRLQTEFTPEVQRLSDLVGRDLTAWSRS